MKRVLYPIAFSFLLISSLFGQTPEKPLTFELADVHATPLDTLTPITGEALHDRRYQIRNVSVLDLIRTAYGVEADKVVDGPNWLASDRFDVIAKTPAGVTRENARLMLRELLSDHSVRRFTMRGWDWYQAENITQ